MAEVTRQDIEETVLATDFDFDQFVSLITKHVEIQIPNELNNPDKKKELVDFVFNAIQKQDQEDELQDETVKEEQVQTEEPEIKIDLNLGSLESVGETIASDEEPEMEVDQETGGPSLGNELDKQESSPPASVSPSSSIGNAGTGGEASSSFSTTPPFADRKSHIIALVKESKWTLRQITQIIDDKWGYAAQGKSSKTRVSKTIRDLRDNNMLYEESNGILMWRGE